MVYLDLVVLLNLLVDWLLLMGANRLSGYPPGWGRTALAAGLGGVYGGACLVPPLAFLGGILWRIVFLALMAVLAFGFSQSALRRGVLFAFLSFALGGAAAGLGRGSFGGLCAGAALVGLMGVFSLRSGQLRSAVPVTLQWGGRTVHLTALHDSGNLLRDPVSGERVLVADASVAGRLLSLTEDQLRHPAETLTRQAAPGLRLIPYHAVGKEGAMLLAVRCDRSVVGHEKGRILVAFAPERLSRSGAYQALIGGTL